VKHVCTSPEYDPMTDPACPACLEADEKAEKERGQ
jgi:hypothetical protein